MYVFFFSSRRRHTRCGRDWSSDVCSSDLLAVDLPQRVVVPRVEQAELIAGAFQRADVERSGDRVAEGDRVGGTQIGRASCRERVEMWVVAGALKKKDREVRWNECGESEM